MAKAVHLHFDLDSILWCNFILKSNSFQKKRKLNSAGEEIEEKLMLLDFFPSVFFQASDLLKSVLFCKAFGFYEKHMFQ